jgi:broad specificity phosphatase PhoE
MTTKLRYLTHPQVALDPDLPVPDWGLSAEGLARTQALAKANWLAGITRIVSSGERKAVQTAEVLANALHLEVERHDAMHENDRSSTGFLPPREFEAVADAFFRDPEQSVRGWERAVDAQERIVREIEAVLSQPVTGDILVVGHGAAGTLLFCHYAKLPIDRAHDQPAGGGHYFTLAVEGRRVLHPWRPMETPPPALPGGRLG